ncbi:16402_t:CDS:2, partial [Dentiscutata heterogama]
RPVALKSINDSKDMSSEYINELKIHHRCISATPPLDGGVRYDHGFLRFFGITQNPETNDYIMITELAPYKDIRNLLRQNFTYLSWSDKLYWLRNIAGNLVTIHNAGYTHRNLHPGNILMGQIKDGLTVAKLAHLGLSHPEILDDTFNAADKIIPSIDISFTAHPDAWYKSRLLNFEGVFVEG